MVASTAAAGVVTVLCSHKGLLGNDIQLLANYLGAAGGENPVPGVTLAFTPMAGGTTNPLLTNGLANLSARRSTSSVCRLPIPSRSTR